MTRLLMVLCTSLLTMIGFSLAQAEEPMAITLSCDGTTKAYLKSEESINPVTKMGVVVNLAERTVSFDGHVAHIDHVDAAVIYFGGSNVTDATGYIDGKTGVMTATNMDGHKYSELMNLSALPRLAHSQGCTTSRRLTAAKRKLRDTPRTHATKETTTPKQARTNTGGFGGGPNQQQNYRR